MKYHGDGVMCELRLELCGEEENLYKEADLNMLNKSFCPIIRKV